MTESAKTYLKAHAAKSIEAADQIVRNAEAEGRTTNATEQARAYELLEKAEDARKQIAQIDSTQALRDSIEADYMAGAAVAESTGYSGGTSFGKSVENAGFNVKSQPVVEIPLQMAVGKAFTIPGQGDLARSEPIVAGLGQDTRWLFQHLPSTQLDGDLSIQTFRQTGARTVTGTVERVPTATTDKATLGVTITAVNESVKQMAIIIDGVPTAVVEDVEGFREFLDSEGKFQVRKALDTHVLAQVVASSPPFGTVGADLIARIRNGIASMKATGFNPTILVINPTDAALLDLSADAGGYVFPTRDTGTSSPLWGLKVVERIGAGNEPPYLIDPEALGRLYLGSLRVEADPYAGAGGANFKKNLVDIRFELKALYHVRQAEAARRIAAA